MTHPVEEILNEAKETFLQRNAVYGDGWENYGHVMFAIFGDSLQLKTAEDYQRMGAFHMALSKLLRYAASMNTGGHLDSAHDLIAYAAILEKVTEKK